MSGYIEDKINIYVDVRELAKPHDNLIVDKIVENLPHEEKIAEGVKRLREFIKTKI